MRFRSITFFLAALLLLTAIQAKAATEQEMIEEAKKVIAEKLKDPESARFKNVSIEKIRNIDWVVGEYNAKNSFGGYVGFSDFAYDTYNKVGFFKEELRALADVKPWALLLYDDLFRLRGK